MDSIVTFLVLSGRWHLSLAGGRWLKPRKTINDLMLLRLNSKNCLTPHRQRTSSH